ncbi:MAG: VWA domain-containing protein [Chloroflexi bacterium]|nr:VWA domain-containing protein [Chloroflexota bacterium]
MLHYRYSRWDGTQGHESPTESELMDHLSDEILQGRDLRSVLRSMFREGFQMPQGRRMMGLQELLDRMRSMRERNLQQYNLASVMEDIQQRLEDILKTEREGIQRRLDELDQSPSPSSPPSPEEGAQGRDSGQQQGGSGQEGLGQLFRSMAQKRLEQLDALPSDVGGRVQSLRDYDFLDPDARQQFEELLQMLQQQMLQNLFQGLQQGISGMTPEALDQVRQMVRDLNQLFQQRLQGQDPDISDFMQKWGQFFPEGIENFDQLAEHMRQQMAQMQSLLNSMPAEMRQQLEDLMSDLLRDHRLQLDLAELAANLQQLFPTFGKDPGFPFTGDDPLTLQEALRLMGDLNRTDDMERQLREALRSNDASNLNAEEIGRLLGEEARRIAEELQRFMQQLEEAGLIRKKGDQWELTPLAIRKIGEHALQNIFSKIRGRQFGDHTLEHKGIGLEFLEETKPYAYGDPLHLDTVKTVQNAVIRGGVGTPVHLKLQDFEVIQTMTFARCSTVIALDMSYSMIRAGYFQAGQRVALALDTLIRTQFPKDNLTVLAFSYFVLPLKPSMLLDTYWVEYGGGTNFQVILQQARRILDRQGGTKQLILITDGHPTTYNPMAGGYSTWPERRVFGSVLEETMREVMRCTKDDITINTFMLDRSPSLLEFVRMMTKLNRGRAFLASAGHLGEYVLLDYLNMRNKVIS